MIHYVGLRESLIEGLRGRLEFLADEDLAVMNFGAGRSGGLLHPHVGTCRRALDLSLMAATRLLQRSHSRTREVLAAVHHRCCQSLLTAVGSWRSPGSSCSSGTGCTTARRCPVRTLSTLTASVQEVDDVLWLVRS